MVFPKISIDEQKVIQIAKEYDVDELCFFGSVLREDFSADSDIDILVTIKKDSTLSFFELYDLKEKLENFFNRKVDIVEKDGLKNPYRRKEILSTARKIYVA